MKVKKILKNFDGELQIIIFNEASSESESSDDILWTGLSMTCPWDIAEMYLDTDDNGEAMFLDKNEKGNPRLNIYVREEKRGK